MDIKYKQNFNDISIVLNMWENDGETRANLGQDEDKTRKEIF